MSRSEAFQKIDFERFKSQMKGIVAVVSNKVLDEAPDAYKDIATVIDKQNGVVVDVQDHISSLINVKSEHENPIRKKKRKKKKKKLQRARAELFSRIQGSSSEEAFESLAQLDELDQELERLEEMD